MHMTDALLSTTVGISMSVVSLAAIGYSIKKIKEDDLCEKKIPIMGVMGAFVFASQMINFSIPGTGSSGHIGGGILLAATLGGFPALLAISAVLIIQCLFFADGGLLALGCNIFNIGIIPCLIVYPLLFKPLIKNCMTMKRITLASIIAVVIGLQFGAFSVVLETHVSNINQIPFSTFLILMQPIHLAIGIIEGIITASILCFVHKLRPEIMESTFNRTIIENSVPMRSVLITLVSITLVIGGALSLFASSNPDGLEWSIGKIIGDIELKPKSSLSKNAEAIKGFTVFMPDYGFKDDDENIAGTSTAGIVGGTLTFILAGVSALGITLIKKKKKRNEAIRCK